MRGWIWIPPGDVLPQAFMPRSDELAPLARLAGVLLADETGEASCVLESMLDTLKVSASSVEEFHGEPNTIDVLTWMRQLQDGTLVSVSEQQYYLLARSALALRQDTGDTIRSALGALVVFAYFKEQTGAECRRLRQRHTDRFILDFRPADEVCGREVYIQPEDLEPEHAQTLASMLYAEPDWDEFKEALVSFVQTRMGTPEALPEAA